MKPDEANVNKTDGYAVKDNTDPVTMASYPYEVSAVVPHYKVTVIAPDPKRTAEPPVCTPEDTSALKDGSKVTVKAGEAADHTGQRGRQHNQCIHGCGHDPRQGSYLRGTGFKS